MKTNNSKGLIIDPGLCRCCGSTKKCRLLNLEYVWMGQKEVYSDMFVDTFGLLLSHLDGEPGDRLVCATCVSRLRDASAFRKQVLLCEEGLLQSKILVHGTDDLVDTEIKQEADSKEDEINLNAMDRSTDNTDNEVKTVPVYFNDEDLDDHCSDSDANIPADEVKPEKKSKKQAKNLKPVAKGKKKGDKAGKGKKLVKKSKHGIPVVEDRKMQQIDQIIKKIAKQKKVMDDDKKAFHNTVTIVENSFVCPFDTSFSDYYCIYCRQVYTEPDQLREHSLTHDPTKFKECVQNKKTPQIDILRIDCRLCAERIDDLNYLKNHLRNTHGKTLYDVSNEFLKFKLSGNLSCLECGSGFRFFHALKKHMAEHFGTWICDICGAHYFDERMLLIHQKAHQRIEENYPCSDCDKTFKSKHSRYLHETRTHKKEPTFQCPKCDEVLFSYSLRYRHMIEIHGEQRSFKCDQCERSYDSRKSLREHTRRFHAKIMKHQCDLCDKRFYIPSRLKEHMATHTGERNFRCEYCGKSYPRLRGLKVHMQSHSSEKKYGCTLCSASFTQNVNLRNHIKRQHQSLELEDGYND